MPFAAMPIFMTIGIWCAIAVSRTRGCATATTITMRSTCSPTPSRWRRCGSWRRSRRQTGTARTRRFGRRQRKSCATAFGKTSPAPWTVKRSISSCGILTAARERRKTASAGCALRPLPRATRSRPSSCPTAPWRARPSTSSAPMWRCRPAASPTGSRSTSRAISPAASQSSSRTKLPRSPRRSASSPAASSA